MMKGTIRQVKSNKKSSNDIDYFQECQGSTRAQWINFCVNQKISYAYMEHIWKECHVAMPSTITDQQEKNETMVKCLKEFNWDDSHRKSLIIQGPPGCGKTNWAKIHALKPALFVSHLDRLKDFKVGVHRSIIFDDLDFHHLPRTSQIHLVDRENPRDIHIRYCVAHIPAGVQKIFTCNHEPFTRDDAIRRRVDFKLIDPINRPFI